MARQAGASWVHLRASVKAHRMGCLPDTGRVEHILGEGGSACKLRDLKKIMCLADGQMLVLVHMCVVFTFLHTVRLVEGQVGKAMSAVFWSLPLILPQ